MGNYSIKKDINKLMNNKKFSLYSNIKVLTEKKYNHQVAYSEGDLSI